MAGHNLRAGRGVARFCGCGGTAAAAQPHPAGCSRLSRRALLGGAVGLGAGLAAHRAASAADDLEPPQRRVDVHHHFFPPGYLARLEEVVGGKPSPLMAEWSAAHVLEHMDKTGVAAAIASISPWGQHFKTSAETADTARLCNDYAAQMSRDHRGVSACSRRCRCPISMQP